LSIDPRRLALDPAFKDDPDRGAALAADLLTEQALRRRFANPGAWKPSLRADARAASQSSPATVPAAVLIALLLRPGGLNVLLTHRSRHLPTHAGQISFPGGRIDADDPGPVEAALREAQEEIGLPAAGIEILGVLPRYLTISDFDVTPVVGLVRAPMPLRLAHDEVEEAFEVPLSFLMNPGNHQRLLAGTAEARRYVYAMPYDDQGRERFIWGVTAAILRNFYDFLRA
jgi:8-oxo-dGTP pyrophosphatase MutT (NUDIX family)